MAKDTAVDRVRQTPSWAAVSVAACLVLLALWLRLGTHWGLRFPVGYGIPLVLIALFRRPSILYGAAAVCVISTVIRYAFFPPAYPDGLLISGRQAFFAAACISFDILVVTVVSLLWIDMQRRREKQNDELEASNAELAVREEEIARSNEELQSQTEESERQAEELQVANEELATRERILQIKLELSRSLKTDLTRAEVMTRICQTMGELVDGAAAIIEREGSNLVVRSHHGFGPGGLATDVIPFEKSFAALVLSREQTGCIEDISLRPDLEFPRPAQGAAMGSAMAAPLRIRGAQIGVLEVYRRDKTAWTTQQVAFAESLAAQTSISLEAGQLFEEVSRERQRSETVVRAMPFPVVVADKDCSDIRLNSAGASLFGAPADYNVAAMISTWRLFHNGQPISPEQFPVIRACRMNMDLSAEDYEWLAPGNRRVSLLGNARVIHDHDGKVLGAVGAFVDITSQKELQLGLDLRRREAEEASVRKTRFLAAVSHDIRTPANAISLLAELVRRTASNPAMSGEVPELAAQLHSSAMSLVSLLGDVLDLARFDSGKVEFQESDFLLSDLLDEAHRQLLPLAQEKNLEFTSVAPDEPIHLHADRIKLARVLGNLIGNAIKFTNHGEVHVSAELNGGGTLRISVADTGIGIPIESQGHIFDEFFQLRNPERDRNKGTGLGLTICKRLVDAMGGELSVVSSAGRGSTFTVGLPAHYVVDRCEPALSHRESE